MVFVTVITRKKKGNAHMNGNVQLTVEEQIRLATEGQLDELRLSVERSVNKLRGRLSFDRATEWGKNSQALDRAIESLLLAPPPPIYTKRIFKTAMFILDAVDDDQTTERARKVFKGGLDPAFLEGLDIPPLPQSIKSTKVSVNEMIENGNYTNIYCGLSLNLDSLCLPRAQIIQFCEKYKNNLRGDRYGTFFLYKQGEEFFVAYVHVNDGRSLRVVVDRFLDSIVWRADDRHSVVVPQLDTLFT
jgi:hypothetical protein